MIANIPRAQIRADVTAQLGAAQHILQDAAGHLDSFVGVPRSSTKVEGTLPVDAIIRARDALVGIRELAGVAQLRSGSVFAGTQIVRTAIGELAQLRMKMVQSVPDYEKPATLTREVHRQFRSDLHDARRSVQTAIDVANDVEIRPNPVDLVLAPSPVASSG